LRENNIRGYGGLDLSETFDLTAWVMIFPTDEKVYILPRFWITRKAIETRHKRMKPAMLNWAAEGYIHIIEADVIDYTEVNRQIVKDLETYNVRMVGYDQYQAPQTIQYIEQHMNQVQCVKVPQSTTRLNAGSKELTRRMGLRQLAPNGNPVLRWNADNASYKMDSDGNIKPSKADSTDKIDGITALVNALTVHITEPPQPEFAIHVFTDTTICNRCGKPREEDMRRCPFCGARYEG
jgi:phage terminase large subunit-like protein